MSYTIITDSVNKEVLLQALQANKYEWLPFFHVLSLNPLDINLSGDSEYMNIMENIYVDTEYDTKEDFIYLLSNRAFSKPLFLSIDTSLPDSATWLSILLNKYKVNHIVELAV